VQVSDPRLGETVLDPACGTGGFLVEAFGDGVCARIKGAREENERAWKVPAAELLASNCNLDRKNPRAQEDITHLPPEQLVASILEKEQRIVEIVERIRSLLGGVRS
jgi:Putative RNA methylase family UPF0020